MEMSGLESGDVCVHWQDGKLIIVTGFKPNRPKYPVVFQMAGGKGGKTREARMNFLVK